MRAVDLNDKGLKAAISRELNTKIDRIKNNIFTGERDDDDKVVKAVKTFVNHINFLDKTAKVIWLSDLTSKDLEIQAQDRFTVQRQMLWYAGTLAQSISYIGSLDRITDEKFFSNTNITTRHPDKMTPLLAAKFDEVSRIASGYHNRGVNLINQSQAVTSRMNVLKKKAPDPDPGVVDRWRKKDYHWHRDIFPITILGSPHAYLAAPLLFKMNKRMKTFLNACETIAYNLCYVLLMNNKLVLVEKPIIKRRGTDYWRWDVHCEDGHAVYFPKLKKGTYYLNNVKVPGALVTKPIEKIPTNLMTKTTNVEVRREIVRKIGVEKVLSDLGAEVIDTKENYELVNLKLGDNENRSRPYLKMLNPSTGTWHIEGIRPGITTVDEALHYRNNGAGIPEILT